MKRYLIKEILIADTYERIALVKRLSDDKEIFVYFLSYDDFVTDIKEKSDISDRKILIDFESRVSYNKGDMIYVEGELKIDDFKVIKNSKKV